MARTKSDEKRNAILAAAIRVFAERGVWSTPTSAISRAAGIAEGTLFTYFATKDILVNELYRMLKLELADALLAAFPKSVALRERFWHVWNSYVHWGVASPEKLRVLAQLQLYEGITAESRLIGMAPFAEIERLANESVASGELFDYPIEFVAGLLNTMAETTIAAMAQAGPGAPDYSTIGFEILWRGIAKS